MRARRAASLTGLVLTVALAATVLPTTAARAALTCPTPATGIVHDAPGRGRTVALTFDDGPGPETPKVLDILRREHVRATFFMIGRNVAARPAMARRVAAEGHMVANHSYSHPSFATLTSAQQVAQLDRASDVVQSILGSRPCSFRPPYGATNAATVPAARSQRMSTVTWNVDTRDWAAGTTLNSAGYLGIRARARAGTALAHPLVLMHDGGAARPNMLHELPGIIAWYRSHGYTFVGMDGLTAADCSLFTIRATTPVGQAPRSGLTCAG